MWERETGMLPRILVPAVAFVAAAHAAGCGSDLPIDHKEPVASVAQALCNGYDPCDDGNPCTEDDHCVRGVYCAGVPVSCTPPDLCHASACNPSTGQCDSWSSVECTALNQCHEVGVCNPNTGVCSDPEKADGTPCADGSECTFNDACEQGSCTGELIVCAPPGPCEESTWCSAGTCNSRFKLDGTSCDDGNSCTASDECTAGRCVGSPQTGQGCDDGAYCTVGDTCTSGVCGGSPRDCSSADTDCMQGACNEQADACEPAIPKALDTECDDATRCNGREVCDGFGSCVAGDPVVIDDDNPCTADSCDAGTGAVSHEAIGDGQPCQGAPPCTNGGTCGSGVCTWVWVETGPCSDGDACTTDDHCTTGGRCEATPLPPGDSCWQSPDPTIATRMDQVARRLYDGENPQQLDTDPQAFDPKRIGIVRGLVKVAPSNDPLAGVLVKVRGHSEYGNVETHSDGAFELAVNGGEELDITYEKTGYLPVQRHVRVPWRDWAWTPTVKMTAESDPCSVQFYAGSQSWQVVAAPLVTDTHGERRVFITFPPDTHLANQQDGLYDVRITEYTTADDDATTMPGDLPPASAYTYALELRLAPDGGSPLDEVAFSQPVFVYTTDFLGFGAAAGYGVSVPAGTFDRDDGIWRPTTGSNGVVSSGKVVKVEDQGGQLVMLGESVSSAEVSAINSASIGFAANQWYWRVPMTHFSPADFNWPFTLPDGARGWLGTPGTGGKPDDECRSTGSIIGCESQTLGERIPVTGTPFSLVYQSDRVPGYKAARTLRIPLGTSTLASTALSALARVEVEVLVAGRRDAATYVNPAPEPFPAEHWYTWDGLDGFGNEAQGEQPVTVRVGYAFKVVYTTGTSFGMNADGSSVEMLEGRQEAVLWKEWKGLLGAWNALASKLGGWSLDVHHAYVPGSRTLYLGDGTQRSAEAVGLGLRTILGTKGSCSTQSTLSIPEGIAIGPDGALYVADRGAGKIRRLRPGQAVDDYLTSLSGPIDLALAKDGTLYVVEMAAHRVRAWDKDQNLIGQVLGTGSQGKGANGLPGPQFALFSPAGIAIGPDGALYVSDTNNHRVVRVELDSAHTVNTVVGKGTVNDPPDPLDGNQATAAIVKYPMGLAFGNDGTLFVADVGDLSGARVRAVLPSGIIGTAFGGGTPADGVGDGLLGTQAKLSYPERIAVGADGSLYVSDSLGAQGHRIRKLGSSGLVSTIAGTGVNVSTCTKDGTPPTKANIGEPAGVALSPDGTLYFAERGTQLVRQIAPAMPGLSAGESVVPSADGSEGYVVDESGRHLRTMDMYTGKDLLRFVYSGATQAVPSSLLIKVQDVHTSTETLIERSQTTGVATGIRSPYNQLTTLTILSDVLTQVTDPASGHTDLTYDTETGARGLLRTLTDPRGKLHSFDYDDKGLLSHDRDPLTATGAAFKTLVRSYSTNGVTVDVTTAEADVTTYATEYLPNEVTRKTVTRPDEKSIVSTVDASGTRTTEWPDGTRLSVERAPDPRFGMGAPLPKATLTLPSDQAVTMQLDRTIAGPGLAPTEIEDKHKLTAGSSTLTQSWVMRPTDTPPTATFTSAGARKFKLKFDGSGRVTEAALDATTPELAKVEAFYDAKGRVWKLKQEDRLLVLDFDGSTGFLKKVTQSHVTLPETRVIDFKQHDNVGRPAVVTLPGDLDVGLGYDDNGNVTSLTPPGKPAHSLQYTDVDLLWKHVSPAVLGSTATTQWDYDKERRPSQMTRADQATLTAQWESGMGRLEQVQTSQGNYTPGYDATSGTLKTWTAPGSITTTAGFDGPLLTSVKTNWAGALEREVAWTVDEFLRPVSESFYGGATVTISALDGDGIVTSASVLSQACTITPSSQTGWIKNLAVGNVTIAIDRSPLYGDVQTIEAKHNGTAIYTASYPTPDGLGRIKGKTETISQGQPVTTTYGYDAAGRLSSADGKSYEYDGNGNRTKVDGVTKGNYDSRDRLRTYDGVDYTYNAAGELTSKSDGTTYSYDRFGNLASATVNGQTVSYELDALGRRVGRTFGGTTLRYLYGARNHPVAELSATGTVLGQFVYLTSRHVPDLMIKSSTLYALVTDHLGSVRMVVNVNTGAVAQRIDYDAWGKVTADTSPGYQPFGFAGGMYDAHTKLTHFGAREYDAETGRWTRGDPILFWGGDANLYGYVAADPINGMDPSGLDVCSMRSNLDFHHEWIEVGSGNSWRSYGLWPTSIVPFGPGMLQHPDKRAEDDFGGKSKVCWESSRAEDAVLEDWIKSTYPVNRPSGWYFFGVHDCRDFVNAALRELDVIQGRSSRWKPTPFSGFAPWLLLLL